jgi:hypothetical protein
MAAFTSLLEVLYLLSPLLLTAAIAAVVQRFDLLATLNKPMDAGRAFRGKPLFGKGKTWRGLVVAVGGCVLGVLVQKHLIGRAAAAVWLISYERANPFALGVVMGAAAVLGELPNSFTKRRLGIAAGETARGWRAALFYVWDQVDLLTTVWPALLPWVRPSLRHVTASVALVLALHPLLSLIGYLLGARKTAR